MTSFLPLNELLKYDNERLVTQYALKHPERSLEQSRQLWKDLLGWMWLTQFRKTQGKATHLFGPLLRLDDLWHFFILNTRDYCEFCEQYWESYFHHDIEAHGEEHQISPDELADFLEDAFEFLGEAWIDRYFQPLFTEEN
ncbi:hypothetical protein Lbir_2710 [Legionella birminghamensis]|uniref:Uncharacterized conserved protein n=2 Tax=Legionella birminghamensis TaxID=28083 RepID=A0A378I8K5_9GAMM|nr:hypothetical protein Lbir_2710 [Legionella birminghamensis]STX31182.1 Uncharacterized conserved protein [Legionella birminghamensis]